MAPPLFLSLAVHPASLLLILAGGFSPAPDSFLRCMPWPVLCWVCGTYVISRVLPLCTCLLPGSLPQAPKSGGPQRCPTDFTAVSWGKHRPHLICFSSLRGVPVALFIVSWKSFFHIVCTLFHLFQVGSKFRMCTPTWVETSWAYHSLKVLFSHLLYSSTFSGMYFIYKEEKLSLC